MPEDHLNTLEAICPRFEPVDMVEKLKPIFAQWPDLSEIEGEPRVPSGEHDNRLRELRLAGINQVFGTRGLEALFEFVAQVDDALGVGFLLVETGLVTDESQILPQFLTDQQAKMCSFAFGFALRTFQLKGWDWVKNLARAGWTHQQLGHLCRILPFETATWDFVEDLADDGKSVYWLHVYPRGENLGSADIERAVRQLLLRDRPWEAVFLLNVELHNKKTVQSTLICDALELVLSSSSEGAKKGWNGNHSRWDLGELLGYLQDDKSAEFDRVANLEWLMMPLLTGYSRSSPKTLHKWLRENPDAFVELNKLKYYPKAMPQADRQPQSENDEVKGRHAYQLLESFRVLPGTRDDGTIDSEYLVDWISRARKGCAAIDRIDACDGQLGHSLAYSPSDADGTFPCKEVRDVIESIDSQKLLSGFQIGILNKRGVTSRSLVSVGKSLIFV